MTGAAEARTDVVLDLIGLIYDAVADASRWQIFLEALAGAIGASKASLCLRELHGTSFAGVCWSGWSDADMNLYNERYALADPWNRFSSGWPESAVGTDLELCPRAEMEASAAYQEFYLPLDAVHGMGATIVVTETGRSVFAAVRGADAGPFGEPEKELVRKLIPHLRRAALLHGELGSLRSQLAAVTGQLGRLLHPFFIVDALGRILYANLQARPPGLNLENGRLLLNSREQNAALHQAITEVCAGKGEPIRRLIVQGTDRAKPWRLILISMEDSRVVPLGISMPAVTALLIDDALDKELDVSALRPLFALTPAEARVAGKLALGQSIQEIAADLKVSVQTIRTHTKRIQGKTGTSRQGELVSLILRSVPVKQAAST